MKINKEDNSEQKEKHDKFLATRKASIKNESSLLKEMLKKNAAKAFPAFASISGY